MNNIAFTPKLLPWLARKAGISDHRAAALWQAALRHAALRTGRHGALRAGEKETPAYWKAAMDRLLELVAAETLREDAASFGWRRWARWNARQLLGPVAVLDALSLVYARGWRMIGQQHLRVC